MGFRGKVAVSGRGGHYKKKDIVCIYWLQGRCNRNPCRFVHGEVPSNDSPKYTHHPTWKRQSHGGKPISSSGSAGETTRPIHPHPQPKPNNSCVPKVGEETTLNNSHQDYKPVLRTEEGTTLNHSRQDSNRQAHESSSLTSGGDGVPLQSVQKNRILGTSDEGVLRVTLLQGHKKPVTGIALPACSDKLYTGSRDGAVRVWDCRTGECVNEVNLGCEIGCLTSEGPWIFVGLSNLVKVWNVQTEIEYILDGPVGLVHALETTTKDMLFAGLEDGSILAWKYSPETNSFKLITTLKGHTGAVLSLKVGCRFLYSGSTDNTIRRWELDTLQCAQTLTSHTAAVTSLLCWDNYLLSCSLDQTIKVWSYIEDGRVDVMYTHNEEQAVLALFGMENADNKPILFASCNDGSVHLYELPWFTEKGRIFAEEQVRTIESGAGRLCFTGDESGVITVWKLGETAKAS